ncbi:hypothetical protein HA466_0032910 [Hirschfeldia incana]|nr:hypothetical protein HA466_0032910 [Hirschfeldia incana]
MGTVIQGFISPEKIKHYLPNMKRGSVYKLNNFYGSKKKPVYRVFFKGVPLNLMKTVFGFIRMRIFKLTVISKETSTMMLSW